jgi:hypothetical protein
MHLALLVRSTLVLVLMPFAVLAQGQVAASVESPIEGQRVGSQLSVLMNAQETYPIGSVVAQVGGITQPLRKDVHGRWAGTLDLGSLPRGTYVLTVSAQDVNGQTGRGERSFLLDRAPVVQVLSPRKGAVGSSTLDIHITCQDDDPGGCPGTLRAALWCPGCNTAVELTGGSDALTASIDVSPLDDGQWRLEVHLRSPEGHSLAYTQVRPVYVARPPRYVPVARADHELIDFDSERLLATRDAEELIVQRRDTGAIEHHFTLPPDLGPPERQPRQGALSPRGAFFIGKDGKLYEFRDQEVVTHGSGVRYSVEGPWVTTGNVLRNEAMGERWTLPFEAFDVTPRGEVAGLGTGGVIYGWKAGVLRRIAEGPFDAGANIHGIQTDGTHYVWSAHSGGRGGAGWYFGTAAGYESLAYSAPPSLSPAAGPVRLSEGYLLYHGRPSGEWHTYLRRPDGLEQQLDVTLSLVPEALAPHGEAMLAGQAGQAGQASDNPYDRYLGRGEQSPLRLGPTVGTLKFHEGEWYVMLGRDLLRIHFQPGERPLPGPTWTPPEEPWDMPGRDAPGGCNAAGRAPVQGGLALAVLLVLLRWRQGSLREIQSARHLARTSRMPGCSRFFGPVSQPEACAGAHRGCPVPLQGDVQCGTSGWECGGATR